jgi:low temperature requirement protein LtrA
MMSCPGCFFSSRLAVSLGQCSDATSPNPAQLLTVNSLTTNMTYSFYEDEAHNTYMALVSFYLTARLKTALQYCGTAMLLPMIRGFLFSLTFIIFIPTALWIASIHVSMPTRIGLIVPAILLDLYGHGFVTLGFVAFRNREKAGVLGRFADHFFEFFPAMNIEHRVERTNAFVSLVFGYSVVGVMFQSYGGYVINAHLGKALLGLVQAFIFNWIYFDVDGANINTHAIRRSPGTCKSGHCHVPHSEPLY